MSEVDEVGVERSGLRAEGDEVVPAAGIGSSVVIAVVNGDTWCFPTGVGHGSVESGRGVCNTTRGVVNDGWRVRWCACVESRRGVRPIVTCSIAGKGAEVVGGRWIKSAEIGSECSALSSKCNRVVPTAGSGAAVVVSPVKRDRWVGSAGVGDLAANGCSCGLDVTRTGVDHGGWIRSEHGAIENHSHEAGAGAVAVSVGEVVSDGVVDPVGGETEFSDPSPVLVGQVSSLGIRSDNVWLSGASHGEGESPVVDEAANGNVNLPGPEAADVDRSIHFGCSGEGIGSTTDAGWVVVLRAAIKCDVSSRIIGGPDIGPIFSIVVDIGRRGYRGGNSSGTSAGVSSEGTSCSAVADKIVIHDRAISQGPLV